MDWSQWSDWNPLAIFSSTTLPTISADSLVSDPAQKQIVAKAFKQLGVDSTVSTESLATTYSSQGDVLTKAIVDNFSTSMNLNLSDAAKEQVKSVLGSVLKEVIRKANEVLIQKGQSPVPDPTSTTSEIGKVTPTPDPAPDYKPFLLVGGIALVVIGFWAWAKRKK